MSELKSDKLEAAMTYELWDFETGNLVGAYDTEDEALDVVYQAVKLYGASAGESLIMGADTPGKSAVVVAKGHDLVVRATMAHTGKEVPDRPDRRPRARVGEPMASTELPTAHVKRTGTSSR